MAPSLNLNSHTSQLVATAIATAAVTASTVLLVQHTSRRVRTRDLKKSIPPAPKPSDENKLPTFTPASLDSSLAHQALEGHFDQEIISEQLARNSVFLGEEGLARVRNAHVAVIGCGGVGSWCAAMLVRSGVRKVTIVDFDQVTLSSLNRHACATLEDVGTPKVQCLKTFFGKIAPWVEVVMVNEMWNKDTCERIMAGGFDFVVDAIDNIDTKVDLLTYCHRKDLKVISSMGAGCKSDPTRINIGDISRSAEDPLSKSVRRRLRVNGITSGIPVVFSTEKPGEGKAVLQPVNEEEFRKGDVGDLGVLPDFRVRILPVLGTMPGMFGLCCANYVVCTIAEYPVDYLVGEKWRTKMYNAVHSDLTGSESRYRGNVQGVTLPFTEEDIAYLLEEIWNNRSVISGHVSRVVLIRWKGQEYGVQKGYDEDMLTFENVVLMTKDEAKRHENEVLKNNIDPESHYSKEVLDRVHKTFGKVRYWRKFRD